MYHYTFFGATEGSITTDGFSSICIFGYCRLVRPTLAERILQERHKPSQEQPKSWFEQMSTSDRGFVLTVFGGTEIVPPTLMEEYAALRNLLESGSVSQAECRNLTETLLRGQRKDEWLTLTAFAACTKSRQSRGKELKALEAGERAGRISKAHRSQLDGLIGAPESTVADVLGQLATQALGA